MIELENGQRINKSFAITSTIEHKALTTENDTDQWLEVTGYASRMYYGESDKLVIDADQENINTYGIDLKRLKNGILPILFNHQQDKPVGTVLEAKYDQDGLLIKAKIFKFPNDDLTNFVYHAVKSGVIRAFSIGIIVKGFDVVEQEGEEYLQLAKSEAIEVSLVSVPANHEALFRMTNLKSVSGEDKVVTLLSKSALKSENKEACDGFSCAYRAQKEIQMEVLKETEAEEQKEAVIGVTQEAMEQLEEILTPEPEDDTPSVQDTEETEGTVVVSGEADKIVDPNDRPSEEPQQDLEPETQPEPTVLDKVSALEGLDVDNLSDDELEAVYETLSNIVDKIESRVVNEIAQELTTVTAPAV